MFLHHGPTSRLVIGGCVICKPSVKLHKLQLPRKCVYGARPVSAHTLSAIQCLKLVHVGSQD